MRGRGRDRGRHAESQRSDGERGYPRTLGPRLFSPSFIRLHALYLPGNRHLPFSYDNATSVGEIS